MAEKLTQGNHSIEKAFGIIEVMAHNQHPMRLLDIASACKMSSSTVLRMLATMQNCGYVQQDEYTRYFLTIKFCHLSNLVSRQISIRNTVHPYLVELSQQVEEYCTIAIERDMTLVYVDEVNASSAGNTLRIAESFGRTAMLHTTGIGKLFLSRYDEKRLDYYIAQFGLPRATAHTLTTKQALMENLAEIRKNGYSTDDEENSIGVRSIAAPICDTQGEIICGISIASPTPYLSHERALALVPTLLNTARQISEKFFSE